MLILLLLANSAVCAVCFVYFNRQNQIMEQAISQINAYLDGDRSARIECDDEGELYRLFHSINSLAAVLNAHADNELKMMTLLSQISVKAINKIMLPIWRYELFVMVFWLLSELSRCLISSIASP